MPKELHGTNGTGRAGSTPLRAGAQMANASAHSDAGRASHLFLHLLSPGHHIFGCSSAVERLTVNQDVVGSIPTSRARNERKMSGGMPVGVHRYGTTAERPLTKSLSPGLRNIGNACRITGRRARQGWHGQPCRAGSTPARSDPVAENSSCKPLVPICQEMDVISDYER